MVANDFFQQLLYRCINGDGLFSRRFAGLGGFVCCRRACFGWLGLLCRRLGRQEFKLGPRPHRCQIFVGRALGVREFGDEFRALHQRIHVGCIDLSGQRKRRGRIGGGRRFGVHVQRREPERCFGRVAGRQRGKSEVAVLERVQHREAGKHRRRVGVGRHRRGKRLGRGHHKIGGLDDGGVRQRVLLGAGHGVVDGLETARGEPLDQGLVQQHKLVAERHAHVLEPHLPRLEIHVRNLEGLLDRADVAFGLERVALRANAREALRGAGVGVQQGAVDLGRADDAVPQLRERHLRAELVVLHDGELVERHFDAALHRALRAVQHGVELLLELDGKSVDQAVFVLDQRMQRVVQRKHLVGRGRVQARLRHGPASNDEYLRQKCRTGFDAFLNAILEGVREGVGLRRHSLNQLC